MKKIVLLAVCMFLFVSGAAAYQVNIYAPDTITVGMPLVVNGTTTFGIGTPIDVVLYQLVTTSTEVKRKIAYVQSDKSFRVVFDTTHLSPGTYKVEVPASGNGDSISMRQLHLVDRSDEIVMSSQQVQTLAKTMKISGRITTDANSGVQIAVIGPDNSVIYGPAYVSTGSTGSFDLAVPVSRVGDYEVSFTDSGGYIGTRTITIVGGTETVAPLFTDTNTVAASASGKTSRDNPIYFIVQPAAEGPVTVSTSSSVDWVVEYADENGDIHTINDQGDFAAEQIVVNGTGKPLYFKVYPYKYSVSATVSFDAENAASIVVSQTEPSVFVTTGTMPVSTTQKAPLSCALCVLAACIAGFRVFLGRH